MENKKDSQGQETLNVINFAPLDMMIDALKDKFKSYEEREQQFTMWRATYKAMLTDTQIAVHAPTGTGKSLGYIIPALAVKFLRPDFKVTFSTYTLNLQEQLVKDLELGIELFEKVNHKLLLLEKEFKQKQKEEALSKSTDKTEDDKSKDHKKETFKESFGFARVLMTPNFVVLKGTKNYFCRNRLEVAGAVLSQKKINQLLEKSESGIPWDLQSFGMDLPYKEWDAVNVQSCIRNACPFSKQCTYLQSYNNFADTDFFIVNHSLFLTRFFFVDQWNSVNFFVFDEGHKLEKSIVETYTFSISKSLVPSWKERAQNIVNRYNLADMSGYYETWLETYFGESNEAIKTVFSLFDQVAASLPEQACNIEKSGISPKDIEKLTAYFVGWMKDMFKDFNENLVKPAKVKKDKSEFEQIISEVSNWLKSIMDLKEFALLAFGAEQQGQIWFELNFKAELSIKVSTKNTQFVKSIFDRGALVTSGTLADGDSCVGFAERVRMNLSEDIVLPSPFYLQDQTLVYVSQNISPKNPNYQQELEYEIMELIKAGKQKVFVLFTSSKLMKDVHRNLEPRIREMETYQNQNIEVWIQQKGNNKRVINSFKDESVRSVLFGTLSYFEGIDLKGETLTQIILTRLPFSVPTHPIQQILDSNSSYSQWEALVRYEQAFGRLIRTEFDYGAFCLLDNRVSYFRQFLQPFEREQIPITSDLSDVGSFFRSQK